MKNAVPAHLGPPPDQSRSAKRPFAERLIAYLGDRCSPRKVVGMGLIRLTYAVKRIRVRDELVVSPNKPGQASSLWKMCRLAGIRILRDRPGVERSPKHLLGCIRYQDSTWDDATPGCLNGLCTDISKSHVDTIFGHVFGYRSKIDPMTFEGRAVVKPEINCSGGGMFVTCPLAAAAVHPDHIYQRLIDNETSPGMVTEYRVSIICGVITDVIVQRRSIANRLKGRGRGGGQGSEIVQAGDVFSATEIDAIVRFCALMNMDFGELDVLPDVNEGRIYVLDANKTPSYMVRAPAFRAERFRLLHRRALVFRELLRARAREPAEKARRQPSLEGHESA